MLEDKMKALHTDFTPLEQAHKAIRIAKPVKEAIQKGCVDLKAALESSEFAAVDAEIKAALTSVYRIFETASNGLNDASVAPLFGSGE